MADAEASLRMEMLSMSLTLSWLNCPSSLAMPSITYSGVPRLRICRDTPLPGRASACRVSTPGTLPTSAADTVWAGICARSAAVTVAMEPVTDSRRCVP
jgi:hypothetical protein